MKPFKLLGSLFIAAGGLAAWVALLGIWLPSLDGYASFMPLYALLILLGALLVQPRRALPWLAVIAALVPVAGTIAPEVMRPIPVAAAGAPQVRVITHNVWINNSDPAGTAQAIVDARPDVVLLQEVNGDFRRLVPALREKLGYATDCPRGCGLVIVSRWPIARSDYRFRDAAGSRVGPGLVWARIAPPGQPAFTVATMHYPHPWPVGAQQVVIARLAQVLRQIDTRDIILTGDMNLTPWAATMRWQDELLAPLTRMTRALASWRRPLPVLPIDHVYAGPGWGLVSAQRLPATGSDHYPLLIILGRR